MAVISFSDAQGMATQCEAWMSSISKYIQDPVANPAPMDIYGTQKLAFKIDRAELEDLLKSDAKHIVGVLGLEPEVKSLSVIFVGLDTDLKAIPGLNPVETWPILQGMSGLSTVVNVYLKP